MTAESKVITVTGCARGLGRALVDGFHASGHTVAGCSRDAERIAALQRDIGSAFGVADVSDDTAVQSWAARVIDTCGVPDLVINNAGVMHDDAEFLDVPPSELERLLRINVLGVANVMRSFLPAMIERGSGIIANISSGAGLRGYPKISGYCASKHAVEGLSRSVAEELPEGIAVIPLQPGVIHTDMLDQHYGERAADFDSPDVWAQRACPYLLALDATQNGQSLRIPD